MVKVIKNVARYVLVTIFVAAVIFAIWLQGQYVVPILMYHHVKPNSIKDLNTVSPENFKRQMKFLSKYGYKVLSLDEYMAIKKSGGKFAHNSVVITFDDGYEDNYIYAYPVLKKFNFSATEFVISDLVGRKNLLNWDQIKEMQRNGIIIGSHTRRHRYLPNTIEEELKDEIMGSKRVIEKELRQKVDYIAYPTGGFTEEAKELARAAGYIAGFTTNRGYDKTNTDLYELKRIRMNNYDHWLVLLAKYSGYYNVFRQIKKPYNDDDALGIVYK